MVSTAEAESTLGVEEVGVHSPPARDEGTEA